MGGGEGKESLRVHFAMLFSPATLWWSIDTPVSKTNKRVLNNIGTCDLTIGTHCVAQGSFHELNLGY